jgi:hypothetical protein
MLGFIIGTICLVSLFKVLRRGYGGGCGYAYGGCGGFRRGPWHHRHWHGGGPFGDFGGGHDPGGDHGGPWSAERGWYADDARGFGGGRGGFGRPFLYGLFRRLDTTPGQEKVIVSAFEELRASMKEGRQSMRDFRDRVATAVRGESFDAEHMGEAYAKQDDAIETMRKAFVGALAKVHEVLDPRQRAIVAEWIASGQFGFRPFGRG